MRRVAELVRNCGSCPFHDVVHARMTIQAEGETDVTFPAGNFCLHRNNRGHILPPGVVIKEGTSLSEALRTLHGEPFPPTCPLVPAADMRPAQEPLEDRDRALDLQDT